MIISKIVDMPKSVISILATLTYSYTWWHMQSCMQIGNGRNNLGDNLNKTNWSQVAWVTVATVKKTDSCHFVIITNVDKHGGLYTRFFIGLNDYNYNMFTTGIAKSTVLQATL